MKLSETLNASKLVRKASWKFQQTFQTPLKNLEPFVASIVSAAKPQSACLAVDQIVFEPEHLTSLLKRYSLPGLPPRNAERPSVTAVGKGEVTELLHAAFADWLDFLFVPTPKPFVIYADHDEYATFYANTRSNLNRVVEALSEAGFEKVLDYERRF
jgi:hypothetical protein